MSQPKVVSLELRSKQMPVIPPVLHSLRQQAKKQLNELIQALFNSTDDALFEMADRSRSDADQRMFFESMRQVRLQRKQITDLFDIKFKKGFDLAFQPEQEEAGVRELDFDEAVDNISLVHNDDLEVSVAIAGIVSKVTSQFSLPIMQLTKRIDHLCDCNKITERLNPLGPEKLSAAFVESIGCLDIDIKVLIILLKLFERFVMERLGPMYAQSNQLLIDAGVLPDLRHAFKKSEHSLSPRGETRPGQVAATTGTTQSSGNEGSSNEEGSFSAIQSLLANTRQDTGITSAGGGHPISTAQLLNALSVAQLDFHDGPIDLEHLPPVLDLRQLVVARAANAAGQENAKIRQADDDVVNFVGMLFDYILNDRNLAIPMKALIARLQIPIVKTAVIDKSFFERGTHPARQLLNELSSAGIGWSTAAELKRDATYNKIESIVIRVMNGAGQESNIYGELLVELRGWVSTDARRSSRVEQRVKESERGKAKTTAAKETVQKLINQKASGMRLPPVVGRFVSDTWSKVLVFLCVKGGEKSAEWQLSAKVLDDLLWCLQPLSSIDDLNARDAILPELISQLNAGMETINLPQAKRDEHIDSLETQLLEVSRHDRLFLEEDVALDDSFADDFEELDDIVLTEPSNSQEGTSAVGLEPKYRTQIQALQEGTWVEMIQEDGTRLRCRLAAIVQPGNKYVFVNRRGMKVAQKSSLALAIDLKEKQLIVLDESQVFDRALQAVIGNLRQLRTSP